MIKEFNEPPLEETGVKTEIEEGEEVSEVNFASLRRGDKLKITTDSELDIVITGKRQNDLLVTVDSKFRERREEFTARMVGGLTIGEGQGPVLGIIKVSDGEDKNCVYFETLKDAGTNEKMARAMRSTPIQRITLIKKI